MISSAIGRFPVTAQMTSDLAVSASGRLLSVEPNFVTHLDCNSV